MLFPRSTSIRSSSPSSSFPTLRLSSSPYPPDSLFLLGAVSFLFLFRSLTSRPQKPTRVSTTTNMRGGGRPSPITTSAGAGSGSSVPKTLAFSSPESLSEWLRPRLPNDSFASWGVKPGTKTVHNLWLEISQGETSILQPEDAVLYPAADDSNLQPPVEMQLEQEEPQNLLLRTVHVATVRIRNSTGAVLVESHQLLSDGTVRHRGRLLSEKMKPRESIEEAAERAVHEEIGKEKKVRILPGTYETRVEERGSVSYPGLPGRYILHTVDAEVDGLPEEEFYTEETGEGHEEGTIAEKSVFVKKHYWKWVFGDVGGSEGSSIPNS